MTSALSRRLFVRTSALFFLGAGGGPRDRRAPPRPPDITAPTALQQKSALRAGRRTRSGR